MYDDPWYNAFIPRTSSPAPSSSQPGTATSTRQHNQQQQRRTRRESLLEMPNGEILADDATDREIGVNSAAEARGKGTKRLVVKGPPTATIVRRAQSFGDFYDIVREDSRVDKGETQYGQLDQDVLQQQTRITKKDRANSSLKDVSTENEFYNWYNGLEDVLIEVSNEEFVEYKEYLGLASRHFDSLLKNTDASLEILASITRSFQTVKDQTNASRLQCEDLIEEKRRFLLLEKDLAENLQYYSYLEPITKRLNAPGAGHFIRSKEYSDMLVNLDNCISYMESHPSHQESSVYRAKYKVLLTKALSLIRVHFTASLRETATDISNRIADKQLNETTMSALLYAKFRTSASELKQVGLEIQKRAVLRIDKEAERETEYQSLMNELTQSYASIRGKLILPLVTKKIGEIAIAPSTAKDLVAFARSGISYIRGLCADEFDLWHAWFATSSGLYDFLESICEKLFDHLKPRIIQETQLSKLCELCSLIQARYMDDADDETAEAEDEEDRIGDACGQRRESLSSTSLDFSSLIQPVMEDAQTRLVFIAMSVMRNEIELYKPRPEDLQYPSKGGQRTGSGGGNGKNGITPVLSGRKNPVKSSDVSSSGQGDNDVKDNVMQDWSFNTSDFGREHWYPTLAKAVWLLSRIYRLINSNIFDDLAHQVVHQTTVSLHKAASQISNRVSPIDAKLFLIKHLLILKEHILAFDIEYTKPTTTINDTKTNTSRDVPPPSSSSLDFANTSNSFFWDLFQRDRNSSASGSLLNPVNLLQFLSSNLFLPSAITNMIDAKSELDGRLRTVINEYVGEYMGKMTSEIISNNNIPTDAADAARRSHDNTQKDRQPNPVNRRTRPISKHTAIKALKSTRTAIQHNVPILKRKTDEYIDNDRTREMLLAAVLEGVLAKYEKFWENVEAGASDAGGRAGSHSEPTDKNKHKHNTHDKNNNERDDDDDDDEKNPWSPETFAQWCMSIFGIRRVGRRCGSATAAAATVTERKAGKWSVSKSQGQASGQSSSGESDSDGEGESEDKSGSETESEEQDGNGA